MAIFLRKILVISVGTAHSRIAPTTNKPQSSNTADMQQSTNVHDVYHGFQIQPQRQRGIRTEQDTSKCFGTKRQTAFQEKHTQTNGEWLVGWWWSRTEIISNNPLCFCNFSEKGAYFHLTGSNHTEHPVYLARIGRPGFLWSVNKHEVEVFRMGR